MAKEKVDRDLYIKVQTSLYKKFKEVCDDEYKTVSQVIRELMVRYSKRKNED